MPNGAGEEARRDDCRPPLFYKERLGTGSPPHPTRLRRPTFPPRGRLWGWEEPFPSEKPPPPARPAGGRAVTDVRYRAAGQAKKKENPRRVPPTRKGGSREEEPLPPWCSFLRLSLEESRAPPPESAGNPRCRVHPATVPTELPTDDRGPPAPLGSLRPSAQREMGTKTPQTRRGLGGIRALGSIEAQAQIGILLGEVLAWRSMSYHLIMPKAWV